MTLDMETKQIQMKKGEEGGESKSKLEYEQSRRKGRKGNTKLRKQ